MRPEERTRRVADFFKREYSRLVSYTRKLLDSSEEQEPEDIVQDVMEGVFGLADVTRPVENLGAYIYQSVRNRVVDFFRKRKKTISLDKNRDDSLPPPLELLRDERLETDMVVDRRDLGRRLARAFDRLSDREKAVVMATELEGRSFEDLSKEWGEPMGTLLSRKSRAMAKLGKILLTEKKRKGGLS
jgi:RNA polymerase sigma factor (sigma-70 family)